MKKSNKYKTDIFISYRRQDAEAHACMLYRDLVNAGYTVFFDHKTLGAGDFIDNIHHAIDSSTDFLLLLSHDALGDRIYQNDDILRQEIAYAFKRKKQIVGIMLSGFEAFPKNLPDDISYLPHVNCLYSDILDKFIKRFGFEYKGLNPAKGKIYEATVTALKSNPLVKKTLSALFQ